VEVIERLDVKFALGDELTKVKSRVYQGTHGQHTTTIHEALFFRESKKKLDPKAFPMQQSTEREQTSIFFRPR